MSNLLAGITGTGTRSSSAINNSRRSATSSQGFSRQSASAFAATLARTTGAAAVTQTPSKTAVTRQTTATGQLLATLTNATTATTATTATHTGPLPVTPTTTIAGDSMLVDSDSVAMRKKTQKWYADDPVDDAYWAKQPKPVQQLREIDDIDQRKAMAMSLAAQGYSIDVPIMVWGFDAGKTMALRQQYGYTWVPSAMQDPIELAPGLSFPGNLQAYDPNHPPPGSILVPGANG